MVERLPDFPSEGQRINNAVDPEMVVTSEATGSDVVGRHQSNDGTGHTVYAAFKQLVVAACAEFPSGHLVLAGSGHPANFVSDFSKPSASCAAAKLWLSLSSRSLASLGRPIKCRQAPKQATLEHDYVFEV